VSLSSVAGVFA